MVFGFSEYIFTYTQPKLKKEQYKNDNGTFIKMPFKNTICCLVDFSLWTFFSKTKTILPEKRKIPFSTKCPIHERDAKIYWLKENK